MTRCWMNWGDGMCIQGMMGHMAPEIKITVDEKTIAGAMAHAGATIETQNTALIGEVAMSMIRGESGFDEYIWFWTKKKEAYCTACESEMEYNGQYFHKQPTRCPVCGRSVTAMNACLKHTKLRQYMYAVEWRKSAAEKDSIVMIGIYCEADYTRCEKAKKIIVPILLDVFRYGKSAVRYQRSVYDYGNRIGECEWYLRRDVRSLGFGYFGRRYDCLYSKANFEQVIAGTPFDSAYKTMLEVEKHRIYAPCERSELMAAIAKKPWIEYMAKAGFHKLAYMAEGAIPRGLMRTGRSSIREIMKLSPDRYAEIKGKKLDISPGELDIIQRSDAAGAKIKLAEAQKIDRILSSQWMRGELLKSRKLTRPLIRYILRLENVPGGTVTLRDYWDAAVEIGLDLTDPETYLPANLQEAHDRAVQIRNDARQQRRDAIAAKNEASHQAKIDKLLPKLEKEYCFEYNGLILRPARSGLELIQEGNALHHCVGGYVERYAGGHTIICFLRRAETPDTPWRTIEINPQTGAIVQDRGERNDIVNGKRTMTPELRAELNAFWKAFRAAKQKAA